MSDAGSLPDALVPRPFRVAHSQRETDDITTFVFEPADSLPCFRFRPAQIGMVGLPGLGEVPISFSSDPARATTVGMTIRRAGAITTALLASHEGDIVSMRGPFGTEWPMPLAKDKHLLFVAGGLGLAPLRSAVLAGIEMRLQLKSLTLAYGARHPAEHLFASDLAEWQNVAGFRLLLTVDRPSPGWSGRVGLVNSLFDVAVVEPAETVVMACGPDVMLGAVGDELIRRLVPASSVAMTLERNMKCAIGLCGHCQFGPFFLCTDGPVLTWAEVGHLFRIPEV